MTGRLLLGALLGAILLTGMAAGRVPEPAQTTGPALPSLAPPSLAGVDVYGYYCASCHGEDGRGTGPAAPALRASVPDLTTLARRHGGTYPADRVRGLLTHGETLASPAHGSREMPVWGPVFLALDPNDTRARVAVDALVEFLRGRQTR